MQRIFDTAQAGKKAVAVAGTPESLGSTNVKSGIYIMADPANTGLAYVFPEGGAKTDVPPLNPGDTIFWPLINLGAIDVDVTVGGEGVYWWGAS